MTPLPITRRAIVGASLIVVAGSCAVAIGHVIMQSVVAPEKRLTGPRIEVGCTTHDFGYLESGAVLEAAFNVRNRGDQRLILRQINGGCGCLVPRRSEIIVEPGAVRAIDLALDTRNILGPQRYENRYRTNDPLRPVVSFAVMANVRQNEVHANPTDPVSDLTKSVWHRDSK